MILLFTDFGEGGPYIGQVEMVLAREAPGVSVVDLMHDAPAFRPRASAYLLAALADEMPTDAVVLGVVDPGVGGDRDPIVVEADGRRFVGPDNGLFEVVIRRASEASARIIEWRPERLSASFHGRDLFAPVAARLARGEAVPGRSLPVEAVRRRDWPDDLAEIVYVDHYGNAMTGLRAATLEEGTVLVAADKPVARARTFSDLRPGQAFWYENANGLAEIAVNQASAAEKLGLEIGSPIATTTP